MKYHNDAYHNNKRHICDICNKSYNYQKSLKYHYDTVHEGIKPQPKQCICELCGKVFCNSQSLKNHVSTIHEELKPFSCQKCGEKFSLNQKLKRHIETVHENKTQKCVCDLCGKEYSHKSALKVE